MTNTTEMTVARALAELKLLDSKIQRTINGATFIGAEVGKKVSAGFKSVDEIANRAKSDYQSSQDLIKRRNVIKSAIVVSNAQTKVNVAGVEMSVAEAIERKTSIEYDKTLLNKMKRVYAEYVQAVDRTNEDMKERLDKHLETLFGKEGKASAQANEDIVKAFKADNEAKLVDPLDLKDKIDKLEAEIENFEAEVDFTLSEVNVLTRITV